MASKGHFSISKVGLDPMSDSGSDTEPLTELSDSNSDSWQDSSSDSDTDQRSSDSDDSAPELSDVRTWCPIDCDDVIEKIVTETNRYNEQQSATLHSKFSRNRKWEPVAKEDIWKFLGLILLQGVVGKPLQKWYWTTNKLLATPFFGTIMSEYRFSLIMKNLHFTNNEEFDEATHPAPKLKKIWEVYQMLLKNFQQAYVPNRDISTGESMMAYKGRLSWIQYIASKRARFGIKSYMLCESATGYIWNSVIYTGKGTQFNPRYSGYGMASSSVLTLLEPLLNQGYCVTTDNFYTSPELYEFLLKHKTDGYGTVRANRRDLPSMFAKKKLKTGEMVAWQKGKMIAMRWRDKKDVCLMSTVHNTSTAMVHTRGGKDVMKPQLVIDYNNTMGGVDRADQAMTFYPAMRKQQKKYNTKKSSASPGTMPLECLNTAQRKE
ncbi:piggyBac transposable element-derived protein 4-like [Hyla sarda]|uniref:piggyBac transposable element-derived protein 4-like n=1 Tax=Hyla sarda TaxID=327740 RepID=UPI0024C36090|nr:piggyBac transposable element-derived protein 4-like [Hyla sarda]